MAARTSYAIAGSLVIGVLAAAAVSRNESREDFIIRQRVGDFDIDGPRINAPDINGPDLDGPDFDGPNIDAPTFNFEDFLILGATLLLMVLLIVGLVMLLKRFGPGAPDAVEGRTSRIEGEQLTSGEYGDAGWAAFERFCYELMQDPDPSRAVRVTMRYAEGGMGRLEPRVADETPNEWLRRVRADHSDLGHHLAPITSSYSSVRFGDLGASPAERDAAVNALRLMARAACGSSAPDIPGTSSSVGDR